MKKNSNEDFKITAADVTPTEEFSDYYARYLRNHPAELKYYKKSITQDYNKTKDIALFLEELKIVAKAERKITAIAKKSNVERTGIYRMLSKDNNPSFNNLLSLANNLGIGFNAYVMK
jgi:DNA-binding phage protein